MLDCKIRHLIYSLDGTHLTVIHKQKVNPPPLLAPRQVRQREISEQQRAFRLTFGL